MFDKPTSSNFLLRPAAFRRPALAMRAIYAASAANNGVGKRGAAMRAGLAAVAVHLQKGRVAVALPFGLPIFLGRGAVFFYKIGQALRNFCRKALPFRRRQAACRPGGVYVCPKQNFIRIDIANSRNNALVQQTRFDGLFPFPQPGLQIPGVAPGRKRLWPQFANSAICIFFPE